MPPSRPAASPGVFPSPQSREDSMGIGGRQLRPHPSFPAGLVHAIILIILTHIRRRAPARRSVRIERPRPGPRARRSFFGRASPRRIVKGAAHAATSLARGPPARRRGPVVLYTGPPTGTPHGRPALALRAPAPVGPALSH